MKELINRAARDIVESQHVVVLTGAGISTESGIPDFRSPGGLWEKYDPLEFMYNRFLADPRRIWEMSIKMKMSGDLDMAQALPNPAHIALAELEQMGYVKCVITQNIDNLHQKAGSAEVVEFHGNMLWAKCVECQSRYPLEELEGKLDLDALPPRCEKCSGVLKPDAIFFGESIPSDALQRAVTESMMADVMIVVGTSAVVYPAAELPFLAKSGGFLSASGTMASSTAGAIIIEANDQPTQLTERLSDYLLQGKVGTVLPAIVEAIKGLKGE